MSRIQKIALSLALGALALGGANSAFAASSQTLQDDNSKRPSISKPALPADPRGPLPTDASQWDQWVKQHPDPIASKGNKKGSNTGTVKAAVTLGTLFRGDILVGAEAVNSSSSSAPYGYYRHSSLYDMDLDNFISAMPNIGVYRETRNFWSSNYGVVRDLYVPAATSTQRVSVVQNAGYHIGEPYNWSSSKTDTAQWYCSKLSWFEYNKWAGIDIDGNGGYWVTPDDIYMSSNTSLAW